MKKKQVKDKRRQYRSCDKCRAGKRACDASYDSVAEAIAKKVACSNCKKKGKVCTFTYVLNILGGFPTSLPTAAPPCDQGFDTSRQDVLNPSSTLPPGTDPHLQEGEASASQIRLSPPPSLPAQAARISDYHQNRNGASWDIFSSAAPAFSDEVHQPDSLDPFAPPPCFTSSSTQVLPPLTEVPVLPPSAISDWSSVHAPPSNALSRTHMEAALNALLPQSEPLQNPVHYHDFDGATLPDEWDWTHHHRNDNMTEKEREKNRSQIISYRSSSKRISENIDRIYLNDNLIRVYEGAAEHALRCWITSTNTPYMMMDHLRKARPISSPTSHRLVYWRICELDRGSKSILGKDSVREEKKIMEAFHAVILAFAAQWTPHWVVGDRSNPTSSSQQQQRISAPDSIEREDRVRMALWTQARDKLQKVSEIDSFRVIFALIVFAWTEKPKELRELSVDSQLGADLISESSVLDTSSWQGPAEASTLLLAAACRKLLSIRSRVEVKTRRGLLPWKSSLQPGTEGSVDPALEEQEMKRMEDTYHMVYWLGVMIDTETAVLRKHPPVVGDEDSELYPSPDRHSNRAAATIESLPTSRLWDDYILTNSEEREQTFAKSWPCSEARASATLAFSAPVKVLLFRQISRLQTCFWRRSSSPTVEKHIVRGLRIVDHWNRVYRPFLESCRESHEQLPASIQSWYILLAFPWDLAVLLFVEMVQTIDEAGAGGEEEARKRSVSTRDQTLRDLACKDCANLIGTIQATQFATAETNTFEFVRDSGGNLLHTEPWAEIMVHSISATAKSEIRMQDVYRRSDSKGGRSECEAQLLESESRVEKYIWALSKLSGRSHLAKLAKERLDDVVREAASRRRSPREEGEGSSEVRLLSDGCAVDTGLGGGGGGGGVGSSSVRVEGADEKGWACEATTSCDSVSPISFMGPHSSSASLSSKNDLGTQSTSSPTTFATGPPPRRMTETGSTKSDGGMSLAITPASPSGGEEDEEGSQRKAVAGNPSSLSSSSLSAAGSVMGNTTAFPDNTGASLVHGGAGEEEEDQHDRRDPGLAQQEQHLPLPPHDETVPLSGGGDGAPGAAEQVDFWNACRDGWDWVFDHHSRDDATPGRILDPLGGGSGEGKGWEKYDRGVRVSVQDFTPPSSMRDGGGGGVD
ncbi:hypothetical protein IE53DRAFT_369304 [Violaceomyces palustris]|uniref:Uncharacterized protein n=1 Tax=Violaceomyces palustris TaxID=1673888 RepID=A0ACD0NVZ9_9BASI|nr:hypothetical protein IE53DRAFT_369304 [Violaceomyces palustris]